MKNKYYKTLIAVFFIVICAFMLIAGRYVKLSVKTFKFEKLQNNKVMLTMNNNSSYNELKSSLRQKYAKMLADTIEETRVEFNSELKRVLGEEYVEMRNELTSLESEIKAQRNEFLMSSEYLTGKKKLIELGQKIDATTNNDEKEELRSEFNVTLNELSTLNVKFNNVLKAKREKVDETRAKLKELFNSKKDELKKVKDELEIKTKQNIANIISQFNFELKELNDAFSVSVTAREMPFDDDFTKDISVLSKFESDCFTESEVTESDVKVELVSLDGLEDVVVLENTSKLKS